jgi:uncharacterized protein YlzI (FlbEa/FlbD family)
MIELMSRDGDNLWVNPRNIVLLNPHASEKTTTVTTVNNLKLLVKESVEEVVAKIKADLANNE